MNTTLTALIVFGCLVGAVLIGITIRGLLPEAHLSSETKDAVKVAMGLVATMSALVLGLLVSSAKSSYDIQRTEVIQMAAKVAFLDRVLIAYGLGGCWRPRAGSGHARGNRSNKCGPERCVTRQTGIPISKQVILCMRPFSISRRGQCRSCPEITGYRHRP